MTCLKNIMKLQQDHIKLKLDSEYNFKKSKIMFIKDESVSKM